MDRTDQEAVPVLQESRDGDLWCNSESDGWAEETTNLVDTDCQEPGRTRVLTIRMWSPESKMHCLIVRKGQDDHCQEWEPGRVLEEA